MATSPQGHEPHGAAADTPKPDQGGHSGLKLAIELGPLVLFFIANAKFGIQFATATLMVTTLASLVASRLLFGHLTAMPIVTAVFVLGFGALTLWLQDDTFIKMKPTLVNLAFSGALLIGLLLGKTWLKLLFGAAFQLTDEGWRQLTIRWILFFAGMAVLNEIVWRTCSTDTWVSFKAFGILPLTLVFAVAQVRLIHRHAPATN